jgi:hypothetical protein
MEYNFLSVFLDWCEILKQLQFKSIQDSNSLYWFFTVYCAFHTWSSPWKMFVELLHSYSQFVEWQEMSNCFIFKGFKDRTSSKEKILLSRKIADFLWRWWWIIRIGFKLVTWFYVHLKLNSNWLEMFSWFWMWKMNTCLFFVFCVWTVFGYTTTK